MRRIIHNTTALAACLSMLVPHLAAAQVALPARGEVVAEGSGLVLAQAAGQDQQQLTEEELRKKLRREERAARQAAEKAAAQAPDEARQPRQKQQQKQAERDEAKANRAAEREQKAEEKAREAAEKSAEKEDARAARAQAKAEADAEAASRDERRQHRQDARAEERPASRADRADQQQQPQQQRAERPERRQDGQRPARADRPSEEELARRLEEQQAERRDERRDERLRQRAEAEAAARAQAEAQRPAPQRATRAVSLATSEAARGRATGMSGLAALLDREVAGGLNENRLACLSGGVYPCAGSDRYVTPRGVVLERNPSGNYLLAPAEQQIYRVDGDGRVVARDAGGRAQDSEAAREAARETRAAVAAALREDRQRRNVVEQRVTEANRRSSSQDFQSSLRDALSRAERRQNAQQDDDDDKSDLVKALLLGLGAVAVGSMLNNNRQVALSTPDRVVVTRPDGSQEIIKDEVALLREPGSTVTTESFDDGSSRTIVTRPDGSRVVTIRDADLRILRRTLISADGRSTQLIDDTAEVAPVNVAQLPAPAPQYEYGSSMDEAALRAALQRESAVDRRFTLGQIRNIPEVRALVAPVDIEAITFETGSAAITPTQARQLSALGQVIGDAVAANPREMFLIEGHTDTVGPDAMNLALSDRRAESVALALSEYFDVPPENLVVQGYGEQFLKIRAEGDVRENRRASVRRITDLLQTAEAT